MYPGVGTFVLIRPTQTFYERIKIGPNAEAARELAYRLYRICDQKNRSQEAIGYNALVQSWPEVARLAHQVVRPTQGRMGLPDDR